MRDGDADRCAPIRRRPQRTVGVGLHPAAREHVHAGRERHPGTRRSRKVSMPSAPSRTRITVAASRGTATVGTASRPDHHLDLDRRVQRQRRDPDRAAGVPAGSPKTSTEQLGRRR